MSDAPDSAPENSPLWALTVQQEERRLRALHPTPDDVPTCMNHFDDFISCNAVGRQLRSLYRFGEMAHCTHKFAELKFCLSVKGLHPEQRRDAWIRRRAEWWARRRLGASSEDVWDFRTEPVKDFPRVVPADQLPNAVLT
ncbi:hypothetical protein K488DRAFT_57158 [Vararia minispora EC-137]|uniref:Uncharacterized protein n=1 Tax=Vararia minispora EC-137 TaxID=1314806 RepID=A0ACB8QBB2_9AGAM|nr:hypothetical protein K488DRAFT_57158 [Vararia minispora EC-137]